MRIHWLQHVPYEGLGTIAEWLDQRGYSVSVTHLWKDEALPLASAFDALIIMGGSQSVYEEHLHPWLRDEKAFIKSAMTHRKPVLGICLGAQLIADVCGSDVRPNRIQEIGWFEIRRQKNCSRIVNLLPERFIAFHWHGDRFDIPRNAEPLGVSDACDSQGFVIDDRVIGLQFHLEMTPSSIAEIVKHGYESVKPGEYVQAKREILSSAAPFDENKKLMHRLLNAWIPSQ